MKKKKLAVLLSVLMLMTAIAGACTGNQQPTGNQPAQGNGNAGPAESGQAGKDSITISIENDATSLDPQNCQDGRSMWIYHQVYDGLVETDNAGNIIPSLAETWDISDDGKTYTFHLKKDATFHNGEPFTADDVAFTIGRAKTSAYCESYITTVESCEAVDEHTAVIHLKAPDSVLLQVLATAYLKIVNREAVEAGGEDYGRHPIGTGPYAFQEWVTGDRVTLEYYDGYYGAAPAIRNITFRPITDSNSALVALQSGNIDFMTTVPALANDTIENSNDLELYKAASLWVEFLGFNCNVAPFDDKQVRTAIAHAINKEEVVLMAFEGVGFVTETTLNEAVFGYDPNVQGVSYDVDQAKALLAEAGYPDGFSTSIVTIESRKKIAEVIQSQLAKIGVTASVDILEFGALITQLESGEAGLFSLGMLADYPDADNLLGQLFGTNAGANFTGYSNPAFDALIAEARMLSDEGKRRANYTAAMEIIAEDVPQHPLLFRAITAAADADIVVPETFPRHDGFFRVYEMSWK